MRIGALPRNSRLGESAVAAASFLAVLGLVVLLVLFLPPECGRRHTDSEPMKARFALATISQSLTEYAINHDGRYPDTLQPLVTPNAEGHCFLEGFDGHIPRDPWQREYRYEPPTLEHPFPRVLSLGKDGELGGEGDDADIDSDHLKDE